MEYLYKQGELQKLCQQFDVPSVPGYEIHEEFDQADLSGIQYPVIVKPVDGSSSKGISVCENEQELRKAHPVALAFSKAKRVLVERFIDNGGWDYLRGTSFATGNIFFRWLVIAMLSMQKRGSH